MNAADAAMLLARAAMHATELPMHATEPAPPVKGSAMQRFELAIGVDTFVVFVEAKLPLPECQVCHTPIQNAVDLDTYAGVDIVRHRRCHPETRA